MKTTFMKPATLALLAISIITGCKKDKDKSNTELLTQKPWKYVFFGKDANKDGKIDENENDVKICEEDDTYIFTGDGTLTIHDNTKRCDASDPETTTQVWALTNNGTELTFDGVFSNAITKLDDNTLELKFEEEDGTGVRFTYITGMKH